MVRETMQTWVDLYSVEIFIAILAVCLTSTILSVIFYATAKRLNRRYQVLMMGREGVNMEGLLTRHGAMISEGLKRDGVFESRLEVVERQLINSLTGVGLVRFNAFQETGSDLSFSLALLDRKQNGVVLTSIFGREDSRCYGKPIQDGKSTHLLSEEEMQAIAEARRSMQG